MNPEITRLEQRVTELERILKALTNTTTIPFPIEKALASRLGITTLQPKLFDAGDLSSNYAETVNEAGASSYSVLREPDYMLRMRYRNFQVVVPAFDT